jgi:Concanavalin A-like lectin/glucanases superfamily
LRFLDLIMRYRVKVSKLLLLLILLSNFSQIQFTQNSMADTIDLSGIHFDGSDSTYLKIAHKSVFNVGSEEFTFSWWQKSGAQIGSARIFQFGSGAAGSDGFAMSHEGNTLYFWLDSRPEDLTCESGGRCGNRVNAAFPNDSNWHHVSVVRDNEIDANDTNLVNSYLSIFIDGTRVSRQNYLKNVSNLSAPTNGLDLYIGGNSDPSFGWYGYLTGFEFLNSAKYTGTSYSPPTTYISDSNRLVLINPSSSTDFSSLKNLVDNQNISKYGLVTFARSNFRTISNNDPADGDICFEILNQNRQCSDTQTVITSAEDADIYFEPDLGYHLASVSLDGKELSLTESNKFSDDTNLPTGFVWNFLNWSLEIQDIADDVNLEVTFERNRSNYFVEPVFTDTGTANSNVELGSRLFITSADKPIKYNNNDYIVLEIPNPIENESGRTERNCRYLMSAESGEEYVIYSGSNGRVLELNLPDLVDIVEVCPNYHQTNLNSIRASLFLLFDLPNSINEDDFYGQFPTGIAESLSTVMIENIRLNLIPAPKLLQISDSQGDTETATSSYT